MTEYFNKMCSNSVAGSSVQTYFYPKNAQTEYTGRVFYRIKCSGKFNYSFLFQSLTDSSFPIANVSSSNFKVSEWEIVKGYVAICDRIDNNINLNALNQIYFDGKAVKKIREGGFFFSDKISLDVKKGEYICLQITYKGKKIPHHFENTIPTFKLVSGEWVEDNQAIFASMIGCERQVKVRIGFLGDSITQGVGVENNSYENWCARLSEKLGDGYAFWNLGIGYGMANDCAKNNSWLYKAKQNDLVVVCFGVNDILRINDEATTKKDLLKIVTVLKKNKRKVVLQTIPPFNYDEEKRVVWENLNTYIKNELAKKVDSVFDTVEFLKKDEQNPHLVKYGGHPNSEGCKLWAEKLYTVIKRFL